LLTGFGIYKLQLPVSS